MNFERGIPRLVVSSEGLRHLTITCNLGVIYFDNVHTAKKLAEEILEQVAIGSRAEVDGDGNISQIVIGKGIAANDE